MIQNLLEKLNEYGELPGCFADDAESVFRNAIEAGDVLERGCKLYCDWYDTGEPDLDGSAIAYELVSCMRKALTQLKAGTDEDRKRQELTK